MRATCPRPPHPPATSSLLGREIFLRALFPNIHRLISAFSMRGKISQTCEATCLITNSDRSNEVTMIKVVVIMKVVM